MARLLSNIDGLHEARLRYMYATATVIDWSAKSEEEHLGIMDAIKRRDIASACAFLDRHINDAGDILVAAVGTLQG